MTDNINVSTNVPEKKGIGEQFNDLLIVQKAKSTASSAKTIFTRDPNEAVAADDAFRVVIFTALIVWFLTRWLTISTTMTALAKGKRPGPLPFTSKPLKFEVSGDLITFTDRMPDEPTVVVDAATAQAWHTHHVEAGIANTPVLK